MKCPKCDYLGFDTGDRCRNCGYDFALASPPSQESDLPLDLMLNPREEDAPEYTAWRERVDHALRTPAPPPPEPVSIAPPPPARGGALPLFGAAGQEDDDEPLLRFPTAPRAPLSVRRTPDAPRPPHTTRTSRRAAETEPVLQFGEGQATLPPAPGRDVTRRLRAMVAPGPARVSAPGRRLLAAAIDHAILFGIDLAVVYFTLRMAALTTADWALLPPAPFIAFLVLIKLAYFCAFTAVGGQTIGKMAVGIRVVADDDGGIDGARAMRRTVVGAFSALIVGLGFLPALVGPDRRALHDRVAHTRVVMLRSV